MCPMRRFIAWLLALVSKPEQPSEKELRHVLMLDGVMVRYSVDK